MSDFLKCDCPHCGQSIEYPAEETGETVPCPTCEKPFTLTPRKLIPLPEKEGGVSKWSNLFRERDRSQEVTIPSPTREKPVTLPLENPSTEFSSIVIPAAPDTMAPATTQTPKEKKTVRTKLSKLTEETIRARTKAGDTPLHRAAKNGQFHLIPSHLLNIDLFEIQNNGGQTCLHVAAKYGTLHQIPRQFLTKETLTISSGTWVTGSGYQAHGDTVLHTAAINGHFDQIPKEFMMIEFLKIEATGYRNTVLQYLLMSNSLDVIPGIHTNSALLDYKNSRGWTLRQEIEAKREREVYVAHVRSEPATEKQKEKLRYFGYAFDENISKGQASDALDKCVKEYPEKERAYYGRPATEEQMAKLRSYYGKKLEDVDGPLTYGNVKELIWLRDIEKRHDDQLKEMEKMDYETTIFEFLRWREDLYRHLTYSRVKKAARALDKINPGWSKLGNCQDLLLEKVTELFPEFAAKEGWS